MLKYIICCLLIFFSYSFSYAQKVFQPKQIEYSSKGLIYKTESSYDIAIHTYGFYIGKSWGQIKTYYKTKYYTFNMGLMKNQKERRQNKNVSGFGETGSKSFVYGKRNTAIMMRIGVGEKKYLSEKSKRKGAAIGVNYEGGMTLAILKPYGLKLLYTDDVTFENELRDEIYSEENEEKFLDYDVIFGGIGSFKGLGGTTVMAGIHAKLGLQMAFGAYDRQVKALEAGVMLDLFPTKVPIMVDRDQVRNARYFLNIYITMQFGKRK